MKAKKIEMTQNDQTFRKSVFCAWIVLNNAKRHRVWSLINNLWLIHFNGHKEL